MLETLNKNLGNKLAVFSKHAADETYLANDGCLCVGSKLLPIYHTSCDCNNVLQSATHLGTNLKMQGTHKHLALTNCMTAKS